MFIKGGQSEGMKDAFQARLHFFARMRGRLIAGTKGARGLDASAANLARHCCQQNGTAPDFGAEDLNRVMVLPTGSREPRTSVHALEDEHRLDLGVPDRSHQRHQARVTQVVQRVDVAPQLGQAPPRPRLARDPRVERDEEPTVGRSGGGRHRAEGNRLEPSREGVVVIDGPARGGADGAGLYVVVAQA